jgi:glutamate-1-semialdehyde 2,1-aminomutase
VTTFPDPQSSIVERARRVLPQDWPFGSVWATHHDGGAYPHFAQRAEGARFADANGREYIDWFGGGGVTTLGHRHPHVQQAMVRQLEHGVHLSLPCPLEVEVAERLCALFPGAEQVAFGKNGTDVTSAAVRLARSITRREHVLISGYHGWQDWSKAVGGEVPGIPQALRGLVHEFGFNDLAGAAALMAQYGAQVAAIVVEPVRWAEPAPDFLPGLRALADRHGCLLVFDEIVTGFRVARGGAQAMAGVRPDVTCLAKSLANGLPLAALIGARRWMRHLPPAFFALTYQREALSLAAAKACLEVFAEVDVPAHLRRIGEAVQRDFAASAQKHGLPWALCGHPSMLHMHFEGVGRLTARGASALFVECCQRAGVYLQPWRVLPSLAHGDAEVERTATVVDAAMGEVRAAAERGLAGRLDGPIWGDFEVAPPPPSAPVHRTAVPAGPWLRAPAAITAAGATAVAAGGADCRAVLCDGRVRLCIERGVAGEQRSVAVEFAASVDGEFRIAAHYRYLEWQAGTGVVATSLSLAAGGERGWFQVAHRSSFGQTPNVRADLAGQGASVPCEYGAREGRLVFERRQGILIASHEAGTVDEVLRASVEPKPVRVRFQLAVAGASRGAIELELCSLTIEPLR